MTRTLLAGALGLTSFLLGCQALPQVPGGFALTGSGIADAAGRKKTRLERWRDEVIYFVMTDRFHNGDPTNDYKVVKRDPHAYHGGDFAGLIQKLPYIRDLGATAIWITPVNDNRDDALVDKYWGYHGYWIKDFNKVEEHLGDEATLKKLVDKAHGMGIKVMLDIVANHTGYGAPMAVDPKFRDWFHHNGNITNWDDQYQLENHDIHGLPDFNTENPDVLSYMVDVWTRWAQRTGVDGYRVDTVKHVPKGFWAKFNTAVSTRTKSDFLLLGEVLNGDAGYVGAYTREGRFDTVFDFPMYFTLREVFAEGKSMRRLGERLRQDGAYANAELLSTFVDNHDVPRFMSSAGGDERKLRMALSFILTARGIPCLYYGTENAMSGKSEEENRADMQFGANPRLNKFVRTLTSLRKELAPLRRGRMLEMWQDDDVYAFSRLNGTARSAEEVIVALNNSDGERRVTMPLRRESQLKNGAVLIDKLGAGRVAVENHRVTVTIPAKQALILVPQSLNRGR
ncbi:MAG: alpha-amylase family glycosyl hydrolase [Candidatus Sericytochromatia bacterium]|nr:alpha-amylase family glycosyl hydrolase [Candidatus Sericytochromatia bacterium]